MNDLLYCSFSTSFFLLNIMWFHFFHRDPHIVTTVQNHDRSSSTRLSRDRNGRHRSETGPRVSGFSIFFVTQVGIRVDSAISESAMQLAWLGRYGWVNSKSYPIWSTSKGKKILPCRRLSPASMPPPPASSLSDLCLPVSLPPLSERYQSEGERERGEREIGWEREERDQRWRGESEREGREIWPVLSPSVPYIFLFFIFLVFLYLPLKSYIFINLSPNHHISSIYHKIIIFF